MNQGIGPVVFTNKAKCRDCYRCLRMCPVKAIRLQNGQASVVPELCIGCGTCIRECPQGAKRYRNDLESAIRLVKSGVPVAASVAPSFAGLLKEWERMRVPAALRRLGFAYVGETATGAWHVAQQTATCASKPGQTPMLCTACPALVNYVTAYRPELSEWLLPVTSPMVAHARMIKKASPQMAVVFIGPCVAKKTEAAHSDGAVDVALTFDELLQWFQREGVDLAALEESSFDDVPPESAGLFPLQGGLVETAELDGRAISDSTLSVSGFDEIRQALDSLVQRPHRVLLEALFCPQGCINGPGVSDTSVPVFDRRLAVMEYSRFRHSQRPAASESASITLGDFPSAPAPLTCVDEEAVRQLLEETGKARPEDQLNCGACGYPSCRAKAEAVLRGMAEKEMCIPLMRHLAEKRTDLIIETSPNGIVIVDEHLNILHMNPAFRRFFLCSDAVLGKKVSYVFDPEPFERLAAGEKTQIETTQRHESYHLVCHEIFYALKEDKQFVGVFVNITNTQTSKLKLRDLRSNTVLQAQELLKHQHQMALQMAKFLGESTAQGEALVNSLMKLAGEKDEHEEDKLPWDTSTST